MGCFRPQAPPGVETASGWFSKRAIAVAADRPRSRPRTRVGARVGVASHAPVERASISSRGQHLAAASQYQHRQRYAACIEQGSAGREPRNPKDELVPRHRRATFPTETVGWRMLRRHGEGGRAWHTGLWSHGQLRVFADRSRRRRSSLVMSLGGQETARKGEGGRRTKKRPDKGTPRVVGRAAKYNGRGAKPSSASP